MIVDLCPYIDNFLAYEKKALPNLIGDLKKCKPDLFVDLSNSLKGSLLCLFCGCFSLRYKKTPTMHAVDNFLLSLAPLAIDIKRPLFPTIEIDESAYRDLPAPLNQEEMKKLKWLGIVCGVGAKRPHRGWQKNNWLMFLKHLEDKNDVLPILIGGPEEISLGADIESSAGGKLINLCGKLNLEETAALIKACQLVIACDTGPAHIAVATGTPVIGIYGATLLSRSGPYGYSNLAISASDSCRCLEARHCLIKPENGPGQCMDQIDAHTLIKTVDDFLLAR
ncbi:MAG: glycosyltransferase family 9 protein [Candidatus Obscuribacterales bacterium]|nr:glycosyltransferase family 9 protein [Candidatus Obscuribacterales bacterium]